MRGKYFLALLAILLPLAGANAQSNGHDYPPFATIDGYARDQYTEQRYESFDFQIDPDGKTTRVEGKRIVISYKPKSGETSLLEIVRTIESQLQTVHAQTVYQEPVEDLERFLGTALVARFASGDIPVWVSLTLWHDRYDLTIVEEKPFQPSTHLSQSDIASAIATDGHVALLVNFDFNKASLRPDALPVIDEVAGVMKSQPDLKLEVQGHTDGIGSKDYNQSLSENRAKTIVAALVAKGIDGKRLKPSGFGASKPVADNGTEEGRAQNRRVELVRQ